MGVDLFIFWGSEGRTPHANANAAIIRAKMTINITQPIVTAMAAALLDAQFAGGKIDIIMGND